MRIRLMRSGYALSSMKHYRFVSCVFACLTGLLASAHAESVAQVHTSSSVSADDVLTQLNAAGMPTERVAAPPLLKAMGAEELQILKGKHSYAVTLFKCSEGITVCRLGFSARISPPPSVDLNDPGVQQAFANNIHTLQGMTALQVSLVNAGTPRYIQLNYSYPCEGFSDAKFAPMVTNFFDLEVWKFVAVLLQVQEVQRTNPGGKK